MKIAIIEDDQYFADKLAEHIYRWSQNAKEISVERFYSGETFLKKHKPALNDFGIIFLDIKLEGITGLKVADILREFGYRNAIVFTTSYREFSLEGYNVGALNYLLKPVKYEDVAMCLERIEKECYFTYFFKGDFIKIPYDDIMYFESSNHHIEIHTINPLHQPDKIRNNLSDLAEKRLPKRFVQCQRSYIVNLSHISKIKDYTIFLEDGNTLSIGKIFLPNLLNQFSKLSY